MATGEARTTGERLPSRAAGLLHELGFGGFVVGLALHRRGVRTLEERARR
jgi:hypothetical protein